MESKSRSSFVRRVGVASLATIVVGPLGMFVSAWGISHFGYQCGMTAGVYSWDAQLYEARFVLPLFFVASLGFVSLIDAGAYVRGGES